MEIDLNGEKFWVEEGELKIEPHPTYNNLILRPELGKLERIIGFVNKLTRGLEEMGFRTAFVSERLSCGGYICFQLSLDYLTKIIVISDNKEQISNFRKNREAYRKEITLIGSDETLDLDGVDIVIKYNYNNNNNNQWITINPTSNIRESVMTDYILSDSDITILVHPYIEDQVRDIFRFYLVGEDQRSENPKRIINYDNLINLCIMVKDAGDGFKRILEENLPFIDHWTILDTGSTDNTIAIIQDVLGDKKEGNLYREPFINFRDSRNRCLDLAGTDCKYNIMLDDTYILTGKVREFLTEIRSDQFADSYNVFIQSGDSVYGSNRITKSQKGLRYIYKIHEIIDSENNTVVQIPSDQILIRDIDSDYMKERTQRRKNQDLVLLMEEIRENPDNPRHLYYVGQTYVELKDWLGAIEYFRKRISHPVEGYREEVTDSYFQIAYISERELNKNWESCEQMYLDCYNHDPTRPDSLFCIGYYYYRQAQNQNQDPNNKGVGDEMKRGKEKAFEYFRRGFELGFPTDVTSNLHPAIYNDYIPRFLTELCYQFKDYELGHQAAERFLFHNNNHDEAQTILSYLKIFRLAINYEATESQRKIFCFVADGGFKPWNGSSILKEGVGGSETYIIEMSRHICSLLSNSGYEVFVFCRVSEEEIFRGVTYRSIQDYPRFLKQNKVEVALISRYSEYLPVTINAGVDKVYFVLHDLTPSGNIIPLNSGLRTVFCLTQWHKEYFLKRFPQLQNRTSIFPNGVDISKYPLEGIKKKRYSFIYSSFPNRGLVHLLRMFPRIKQLYPEATLNIFCDLDNEWANSVAKEDMNEIRTLLSDLRDYGVVNRGWVSKEVLREYWLQSEVWLYPCTFKETFCITALEAAASKTFVITSDLAGLKDTVGDRGVLISGDPGTEKWQNRALEKLKEFFSGSPMEMKHVIERNRKWAETLDWSSLAQRFVSIVRS